MEDGRTAEQTIIQNFDTLKQADKKGVLSGHMGRGIMQEIKDTDDNDKLVELTESYMRPIENSFSEDFEQEVDELRKALDELIETQYFRNQKK